MAASKKRTTSENVSDTQIIFVSCLLSPPEASMIGGVQILRRVPQVSVSEARPAHLVLLISMPPIRS